MDLFVILTGALAFNGVVMVSLVFLFKSPASADYRIREEKNRKLVGMKLMPLVIANSVLSVAILFGITISFYDHLFYEELPAWWVMALEVVGVLFVYDFFYYLLHRYLFHSKLLFNVHIVHHKAKYPTAVDAMYMHPVETTLGLLLLLGSGWLIGPIHLYSFGVLFTVHSVINVLVHCGMDLPQLPFRWVAYLARRHDKHHVNMQAGNYSSIIPFYDMLFGTSE